MSKYYVYTLAFPLELENGRVFYVGKGTSNRIDVHESEALGTGTSRKCDTIRRIWAAGHQVVKRKVFETDNETEAYRKEKDLMDLYGLGSLTNEGYSFLAPGKPRRQPVGFQVEESVIAELDGLVSSMGFASRSALLAHIFQLGLEQIRRDGSSLDAPAASQDGPGEA